MKRGKGLKRGQGLSKRGARAKRDDAALQAFREAVLARGRCEECGADKNLHAHHMVSRARAPGWPLLHNAEVNGACLCSRDHDAAHRNPGTSRWIRSRPEGV